MPENPPTCQIHKKNFPWNNVFVSFPEMQCLNVPMAGDPDGLCILHSWNKEKNLEDFREALMARWNKAGQEFNDFRNVFFPGPFDANDFFGSREFKKPINFHWARFLGPADFSGANFAGRADFSYAAFQEQADFSDATFQEQADFSNATFQERANFSGAEFQRSAGFFEATFKERAVFFVAIFKGETLFSRINPQEERRVLSGSFTDIIIDKEASLVFQDADLSQVRFVGTDLSRVEFHNVTWARRLGRNVVYDEKLPQRYWKDDREFYLPEKYARVEKLYRQLALSYEQVGDLKSSGDFHYGELEMHRRASKWRWFPLYWDNIYWLSSGYGERPLRAVLTLAGLLVVFSLVLLGLEKIPEVSDNWTLTGFWQALLYVLQQGTMQKPDWLKPSTGGGKFLSVLMPILIIGQTGLFSLALWNRLGRRR